jgi:hypothetical protein
MNFQQVAPIEVGSTLAVASRFSAGARVSVAGSAGGNRPKPGEQILDRGNAVSRRESITICAFQSECARQSQPAADDWF